MFLKYLHVHCVFHFYLPKIPRNHMSARNSTIWQFVLENNHFKLFFPKSFILCPSIKAILDFRSTKINTIIIEGHIRNIPNSNNLRTDVISAFLNFCSADQKA